MVNSLFRMIGAALNHYRIIAELGVGGMREVYRARDTKLGREVAIKFLTADCVENADQFDPLCPSRILTSRCRAS